MPHELDTPTLDTFRRIACALEQLVALGCYDRNLSLHVAGDSGGAVAVQAAIAYKEQADAVEKQETLATDALTTLTEALRNAGVSPGEIERRVSVAQGELKRTGFLPADVEHSPAEHEERYGDPLWYDRVRRTLEYLHVPFTDLDDLDQLAKAHGWVREKMADTMAGMGLEP